MRHTSGSIEVITGSMFSGKTDELIRRLRRAHIARQKIQVFKPAIDNRYAVEKVTSHAGSEFDAMPVANAEGVAMLIEPDTTVVAIDEAQFFDWHIAEVCQNLAARGVRVICAGLDMDFRGEPFGPMPLLMSQAETVDKLQAICQVCGNPASRTQRLIDGRPAAYSDPIVQVGGSEAYEARCREHHEVPHEKPH
jgi:thymidine kinase